MPAGTGGDISVYVSETTNVILDIDGYFARPGCQTYEFYPLTPCRMVDTRNGNGGTLQAGMERDYTIAGNCGIPSSATAYSFNVTVLPTHGELDYLTVWPKGESQAHGLHAKRWHRDDRGQCGHRAGRCPRTPPRSMPTTTTPTSCWMSTATSRRRDRVGCRCIRLTPCRVLDTRQSAAAIHLARTR